MCLQALLQHTKMNEVMINYFSLLVNIFYFCVLPFLGLSALFIWYFLLALINY